MNYILVVDDEADIRDIYEMVLKKSFPLDIILAESGNRALEIIREKGPPEIILSDLRMPDGDGLFLYQESNKLYPNIPFVICTATVSNELRKNFPNVYRFIEKPDVIGPMVEVVSSVVEFHKDPPDFIPVRISLLLRWGVSQVNLFMKLSGSRFIKVMNANEPFLSIDAERFRTKGMEYLFVALNDADLYLKTCEKNILLLMNSDKESSKDLTVSSLESLETVERIATALGWSPEVLDTAKKAVNLAIKTVIKEPKILNLLQARLKDPSSRYSEHVGLISLLCCGFCYQLGWTSESTQMKLGIAALMHDLVIDESQYEDIDSWNQQARDSKTKSDLISKYRNHPLEAANFVLLIKDIPPDVDQIILQHHEKKDGSGFPRGLTSSRITPMASVFIIVEDLINFLGSDTSYKERVALFLKERENEYDSGNFKKVFDALKMTVL